MSRRRRPARPQHGRQLVGSAIAFRLFLFFVPLLLFLAGVLGFLAGWIDRTDVEEQTGVTGTIAEQISRRPVAAGELAAGSPPASVSSAWSTTGRALSKVMVSASCLAWQLPVRAKASPRVIGGIIGLIAGIGLVSVIINRLRDDLGIAVASFSFFAAFVAYGVAWVAMSMLLPRATRDPSALLPGAVLVGATIAVMQAISQLYLPDGWGGRRSCTAPSAPPSSRSGGSSSSVGRSSSRWPSTPSSTSASGRSRSSCSGSR